MERLDFEILTEQEEANYGRFVITPLARGYGTTLGNALRRVLLSSLKGAAATKVKIKGVEHRFSTLKGLREDIIELLLSIKQIRFRLNGVEKTQVSLSKRGPGKILAADLVAPAEVEVVNKDLVLGTLADSSSELEMSIEVEAGYGYRPFEDMELERIGVLPIDSVFSPVPRVNYKVEETRVGRVTNLDRLTLEIWTDGTLTPRNSLNQASQQLIEYFSCIKQPEEEKISTSEEKGSDESIETLKLKPRIQNILQRAGITTVNQLAVTSREDLLKIKNFGQKSLKEIKAALKEKGIELK